MLGGTLVSDAEGQLVEPVEQQRDAALCEHVAKGLEVDAHLPGTREVLCDQLVQGTGLLDPAHLDEDRSRAFAAFREL